jgi:hypothetical protein
MAEPSPVTIAVRVSKGKRTYRLNRSSSQTKKGMSSCPRRASLLDRQGPGTMLLAWPLRGERSVGLQPPILSGGNGSLYRESPLSEGSLRLFGRKGEVHDA